ncbi:MAG: hypothetical protein AAF198_02245 [Pseudomonadota bacterium]
MINCLFPKILLSWFLGVVVGVTTLLFITTLEIYFEDGELYLEGIGRVFFGFIIFGLVFTAPVFAIWTLILSSIADRLAENKYLFVGISIFGISGTSHFLINAFFGFQMYEQTALGLNLLFAQMAGAVTSAFHALRIAKGFANRPQ